MWMNICFVLSAEYTGCSWTPAVVLMQCLHDVFGLFPGLAEVNIAGLAGVNICRSEHFPDCRSEYLPDLSK